MYDKIDPADMERFRGEFRRHMLRNTMHDIGSIRQRQLTLLKSRRMLKRVSPKKLPESILAVVRNPDEPSYLGSLPGPLLFLGGKAQTVVPLPELLLDEQQNVRGGALAYLDTLGSGMTSLMCPATKEGVQHDRDLLLRSNPNAWRQAAVRIYDLLTDDYLLNLAGMRQSLVSGYEEGCREYSKRILKPTAESIHKIPFSVIAPTSQRNDIEIKVTQCVDSASSLERAIDSYFDYCGHIPFADELSAGCVVTRWMESHDTQPNLWDVLWAWANQKDSPLARYHACQVFATHPDLVPEGKHAVLWHEITEVLCADTASEDQPLQWTRSWSLRCELARHFCKYIETASFQLEGEVTASAAWWFSDQVAQILGNKSDYLARIQGGVIDQICHESDASWQCVHPVLSPSWLRFGTLHVRSIWSLSLLSHIGSHVGALKPESMDPRDRELIGKAATANAFHIPLLQSTPSISLFPPDEGVKSFVTEWSGTVETEENRAFHQGIIDVVSAVCTPEGLLRILDSLGDNEPAHMVLAAHGLRCMAYSGVAPYAEIWTKLSSDESRERLLLKCSSQALEIFFDAFATIQGQAYVPDLTLDNWLYLLPHLYEQACEKVSGDTERQQLLFAMIVLGCVHTDTTSALYRVLSWKERRSVSQHVNFWRQHLGNLAKSGPSWVSARIRPVLVALDSLQSACSN